MSDPLASLRASLKAGHIKARTMQSLSPKPDPLAALRAQVKAGKLPSAPKSPSTSPLSDHQLGELYQAVIASAHPHMVGLKAVYQAGLSRSSASQI
jgi:hypothetical protein